MNKFLNSKNYKAFFYEKFHHDFFYDKLNDPKYFLSIEVKRFIEIQFKILAQILHESNSDVIIDSTKNLNRLKLYHHYLNNNFSLNVIHLIRNPWTNIIRQ